MAFNPAPTSIVPSWSEDGTTVSFPLASVPNLSAAVADAVTGDSRKVLQALLDRLYAWYSALAAADKPTKVTISKLNRADGTGALSIFYTIKIDVTVAPENFVVTAE